MTLVLRRPPLLALGLLILGSRLHTVARVGSDLPWWDEWDATFRDMLLPFATHAWHAIGLLKAHNEHRIVATHLIEFGSFRVLGQRWHPLVELLASQLAFAAGAALLLRTLAAGALAGAVLYAIPFDWEGEAWGFLSQIYLCALLAYAALAGVGLSRPNRSGYWLGVAAALASTLTFAASLATLVATAAVTAARDRRRAAPAVILLAAVAAALVATTPHAPQNDSLRAVGPLRFLHAFGTLLAFPGATFPGLLQWVPVLLYCRGQRRDRLFPLVAGLALWSLLIAAQLAYARAGAPNAPRYAILLITIPVTTLTCLLRLPGRRPLLRVAFIVILAAGLLYAAPRLRGGMQAKQNQERGEAMALAGWLDRRDAAAFGARASGTYPPSGDLRHLLDAAAAHRILPTPINDDSWRKPVAKAGTFALIAGILCVALAAMSGWEIALPRRRRGAT